MMGMTKPQHIYRKADRQTERQAGRYEGGHAGR